MGLPRTHQIFASEVEDDCPGTDGAGDVGIHVGYRVAGYLEGEQLSFRMPIVIAEFIEIVSYLAVVI
jgi:hypothetical protein